jgi:hypothetical protein
MEEIFRSLIANTLLDFARDCATTIRILLSVRDFPIPKVFQLNFQHKANISIFPIYDLDEARLQEMKQILERIHDDLGLSTEQRENFLLLYKRDFLTIQNIR